MTKEQEIMNFLNEKLFNPILNSKELPLAVKGGLTLTKAKFNNLNAEKMIQLFLSTLASGKDLGIPDKIIAEVLPKFDDICDEFKKRFTNEWLKKDM